MNNEEHEELAQWGRSQRRELARLRAEVATARSKGMIAGLELSLGLRLAGVVRADDIRAEIERLKENANG